jgi:hypothetical protein
MHQNMNDFYLKFRLQTYACHLCRLTLETNADLLQTYAVYSAHPIERISFSAIIETSSLNYHNQPPWLLLGGFFSLVILLHFLFYFLCLPPLQSLIISIS